MACLSIVHTVHLVASPIGVGSSKLFGGTIGNSSIAPVQVASPDYVTYIHTCIIIRGPARPPVQLLGAPPPPVPTPMNPEHSCRMPANPGHCYRVVPFRMQWWTVTGQNELLRHLSRLATDQAIMGPQNVSVVKLKFAPSLYWYRKGRWYHIYSGVYECTGPVKN